MGSTSGFDTDKSPYDDRHLTSEQIYDSALAAMVTKLEEYVIPLVNEVFGEHFTENARVEIRNNKHIVRHSDGSLKRRETDAYVKLSEEIGQLVRKYYHFECETWYDKSIVLRIAEYASAVAVERAEIVKDGVILRYPWTVVIFLRPGRKIPGEMKITHRAPDGSEMCYAVPALRITDYGLDELFEKKLLLLLPFYLFRYVNDFKRMQTDTGRRKELEAALETICRQLQEMKEAGEISVYQQRMTLELLLQVSGKLTAGYGEVKKGVDRIMTGYILRTEADDILDRGREEGRKEGRTEGQKMMTDLMNFLLTHNRSEDALRATTDMNYLNELLAQFESGLLAGSGRNT